MGAESSQWFSFAYIKVYTDGATPRSHASGFNRAICKVLALCDQSTPHSTTTPHCSKYETVCQAS
jgi:hypothetical protein